MAQACFPAAYLDEQAMEIRLLFDHRNDLVIQRTRVTNRLRWHLLELCPELEQMPPQPGGARSDLVRKGRIVAVRHHRKVVARPAGR